MVAVPAPAAACTVGDLLAASRLPAGEARALLAEVLGLARERLIAFPERTVDASAATRFDALAARRRAGEPMAYLLGRREFYGRDFAIAPAVLVPRPETELLVDLAIEALRDRRAPCVLDLGTGSGCIAITIALECPHARVIGLDRSADALAVARRNAIALGTDVAFLASDWFGAVHGSFDVIVANPPYIAAGDPHLAALSYEPLDALTDRGDGLSCLRRIAHGAPAHLRSGGWLMVEHGHDQGDAVRRLFEATGLRDVRTHRDAAGHDRACTGRWPVQAPG
jgi:release factor glutamine methyltransferase